MNTHIKKNTDITGFSVTKISPSIKIDRIDEVVSIRSARIQRLKNIKAKRFNASERRVFKNLEKLDG